MEEDWLHSPYEKYIRRIIAFLEHQSLISSKYIMLFKTTCNIRSQASNTNLWLCALWTPPPLSHIHKHTDINKKISHEYIKQNIDKLKITAGTVKGSQPDTILLPI